MAHGMIISHGANADYERNVWYTYESKGKEILGLFLVYLYNIPPKKNAFIQINVPYIFLRIKCEILTCHNGFNPFPCNRLSNDV